MNYYKDFPKQRCTTPYLLHKIKIWKCLVLNSYDAIDFI